MSTTSQKPALETPAEESNRVQIGLLSRMLGRPEIGALVAAIVIGIFFLIVAPPFRSTEGLDQIGAPDGPYISVPSAFFRPVGLASSMVCQVHSTLPSAALTAARAPWVLQQA